MKAAQGGHDLCVRVLLEAGAVLGVQNNAGWTALMKAAQGGHDLCVRVLLDAGANPNEAAIDRSTALIAALEGGHNALAEQLRAAGATASTRLQMPGECHISVFSTAGYPDLAQAAGQWYYEMRLVCAGPSPQIGWATAGFSPAGGNGVGDDALSWGADGARSMLWHRGNRKWTVSWQAGDVVGFAADLGKGRLWAAQNGVWVLIFENILDECPAAATSGLFPAISGASILFQPLTGDDASQHKGPEPSFKNLLAHLEAPPKLLGPESEEPHLTIFSEQLA